MLSTKEEFFDKGRAVAKGSIAWTWNRASAIISADHSCVFVKFCAQSNRGISRLVRRISLPCRPPANRSIWHTGLPTLSGSRAVEATWRYFCLQDSRLVRLASDSPTSLAQWSGKISIMARFTCARCKAGPASSAARRERKGRVRSHQPTWATVPKSTLRTEASRATSQYRYARVPTFRRECMEPAPIARRIHNHNATLLLRVNSSQTDNTNHFVRNKWLNLRDRNTTSSYWPRRLHNHR